MKRFIVFLSVLVLAFGVVACGNSTQAKRLQEPDMSFKTVQNF